MVDHAYLIPLLPFVIIAIVVLAIPSRSVGSVPRLVYSVGARTLSMTVPPPIVARARSPATIVSRLWGLIPLNTNALKITAGASSGMPRFK